MYRFKEQPSLMVLTFSHFIVVTTLVNEFF